MAESRPSEHDPISESAMPDLFAAAAVTEALTLPRHLWQPPSTASLQNLLPEYEILGFVARGGMGAVYKAVQRSLNRTVAIKILPPEFVTAGDLNHAERFKQEARAMAKLRHPGIVAVHEANQAGDLLYIVMEYVEGRDVAQCVNAEGKLPPDMALNIAKGVCDALAYAHARGVVHRDIKPSNVMVDATGRVKVADFGLAKIKSHTATALTQSDMRMGTPDFAAPEAYVPGLEVDQRADIYAVGVMLYQMLTGKIPRGRFEAPSSVVQNVDRRFDSVIDKALQVDRERRYSSALELHGALGAIELGPPAAAGRRFTKSQIAAAVGICAMLAAATAFVSSRSQPHSSPAAAAPLPSPPASSSPPSPALSVGDKAMPGRKVLTNTLGMQFLPVAGLGVLMCRHETRRQDYAVFAAEVPGVDPAWKSQQLEGIPCGGQDDHPVCGVSWDDAIAFCEWLGRKEGRSYRLPTDQEWSAAVGIGVYERSQKGSAKPNFQAQLENTFPYGPGFPPRTSSAGGNYADSSWHEKFQASKWIEGYTDGHATTAPVMAFEPGRSGFCDLGGNVWEWCQDWNGLPNVPRLARGGGFRDSDRADLLASRRKSLPSGTRSLDCGFRCILVENPRSAAAAAAAKPRTSHSSDPARRNPQLLTNSLGMKFAPVPAANLLVCIHETRRRDYAAYAADVQGVNQEWRNQERNGLPCGDGDEHPVCGVNWEDAQNFCQWLSRKEGVVYRLPTDAEWSLAAAASESKNDPLATPELMSPHASRAAIEAWEKQFGRPDRDRLVGSVFTFPYGPDFPPKTLQLAGNYGDTTWKAAFPAEPFLEGYSDGFATTSPVMTFPPNALELHDLGGNVSEWVADWYNNDRKERVLRGGSFAEHHSCNLLSIFRDHLSPDTRAHFSGFRVVRETAPASTENPARPAAPRASE